MAGVEFAVQTKDETAGLVKELKQFNRRLERGLAREVIPRVEREADRIIALNRLSEEPPPRNRFQTKFVWSLNRERNARARAWFFKHYPNGYQRTGQLAQGWKAEIEYRDGVIYMRIVNPAKATSYVYGSPQFGYRRVISHARTGWYNAGDRVPKTLRQLEEYTVHRLDEFVNEQIERL